MFEANKYVTKTPIEKWISKGKEKHYVIKRLKNADQLLSNQMLQKMKQEGLKYYGKRYDGKFEWSDNKIYCSELVWKIYQRTTGLEIGKLEKLSDFNLSHKSVKDIIKNRYQNKIPINETVISPASIFNSELLMTVKSN